MGAAAKPVEILNSWKEIATYLSRGVRTVQRWEAELGMPVRRPRGRRRNAVVAVRSELDRWISSCPLEPKSKSTSRKAPSVMLETLRASTLELQRLRAEVRRSREEVALALGELIASMQKMKRDSRRLHTLQADVWGSAAELGSGMIESFENEIRSTKQILAPQSSYQRKAGWQVHPQSSVR